MLNIVNALSKILQHCDTFMNVIFTSHLYAKFTVLRNQKGGDWTQNGTLRFKRWSPLNSPNLCSTQKSENTFSLAMQCWAPLTPDAEVHAKNGTHCCLLECSHSITSKIKGFACKCDSAFCVNGAFKTEVEGRVGLCFDA